jgi:cytochrome c oxidase subunit 3
MAWAVRCAQLGQKRTLVLLLAATLACASFFLGVKAVEYSYKWGEGLLWAGAYAAEQAEPADVRRAIRQAMIVLSAPAAIAAIATAIGLIIARRSGNGFGSKLWSSLLVVSISYFVGLGVGQVVEHMSHQAAHNNVAHHETAHHETVHHETAAVTESAESTAESRQLTGVFFSIYYAMTGVHAVHIVAGMGVIAWLLIRSLKDNFGPSYFGPVDYVGLYWHLVDLVWIYLFPLLYLIR